MQPIPGRGALAAGLAWLAVLAAACRSGAPPAAIDPAMAACLPPGTVLLAGIHVSEIRALPPGRQLPLVTPFLEAFRQAGQLLIAYDGQDALMVARGAFASAPAGATLVAPGLVLGGPDRAIRAAMARRSRGPHAPSALLGFAAGVAAKPVWMVAPGGVTLPLSGNAANLNRLLRDSEFASVTAAPGPRIQLEATAVGRSADAARDVEETLRGMVAMMTMAEKRGSPAAALLGAVEIRREGHVVKATVSATPYALENLLAP
jgi:hypothetical protein